MDRQLCLGVPIDNMISKVRVIIGKEGERLLPSDEEEGAFVGALASGADVMAKVWLVEPWVLRAGFLVLVILRLLLTVTSARDGAS